MPTLRDLLTELLKSLKSFDPGAVEPFFKSAAAGLMVPPPSFEAGTLVLDGDQIALVEGLKPTKSVLPVRPATGGWEQGSTSSISRHVTNTL